MQEISVVCFSVGEKRYGAGVHQVLEAIRMVEISEIPNSPKSIIGIINLRGKVIPVLDLRKWLRIPTVSQSLNSVILVVEAGGKTIGVVVDGVSEVLDVPSSTVEASEEALGYPLGLVQGVAKLPDGLLLILDFDRILSFEEKKQLEAMSCQDALPSYAEPTPPK